MRNMAQHEFEWNDLVSLEFLLLMAEKSCFIQRLGKVHTCACVLEVSILAALEICVCIETVMKGFVVTVFSEGNFLLHVIILSLDVPSECRSVDKLSILPGYTHIAHVVKSRYR